ncbi:isochorismate synthase [Colwellia sp. RE-S-Sl-9]
MKCNNDTIKEQYSLKSEPEFIFTSKGQSLTAYGIECKISNKGLSQSAFIETIKSRLHTLKLSGHENPIVIGSIPFDTSSETELFIPKQTQFSSSLRLNSPKYKGVNPLSSISEVTGENHFKVAVNKALSLSKHTGLNKVVLSRAIDVETNIALNASTMAATLYQQNLNAFIFSIPQSNGTTLIGASPELLVRKQGSEISSNPLAGSRKRVNYLEKDKESANDLFQCKKDRYEHKLVADAVSSGLTPYCQTLNTPNEPSIIETPTMLHLSTKINGSLISKNTNVLELAYALHPTPAICGTPADLAKSVIQHIEGYERDQFCGAVGWMDSEGNGEWVVTIRCGVIKQNKIRLYAGAGIVDGSDPLAEFNETEAKLNTMLKALGLESQQIKPNVAKQVEHIA